MANHIRATIYSGGAIQNTDQGVTFSCPQPRPIKFNININYEALRGMISQRLKLPQNEVVSQIVFRAPSLLSPPYYIPLYVEDDDSLNCMIDYYKDVRDQFGFIELYVNTKIVGFNLNTTTEEGQCSVPQSMYDEGSFQQTQHTNMVYEHQNFPSSSQQPAMTGGFNLNEVPFVDPAADGANDDDDFVEENVHAGVDFVEPADVPEFFFPS